MQKININIKRFRLLVLVMALVLPFGVINKVKAESTDSGVKVIMESSLAKIRKDQEVEFQISLKNNSQSDLSNVLFQNNIPKGLDLVDNSLKINDQESENNFADRIELNLENVKANSELNITYRLVLTDDSVGASFKNFVTFSALGNLKYEGSSVVLIDSERSAPVAGGKLTLIVISGLIGVMAAVFYYLIRKGFWKNIDKLA